MQLLIWQMHFTLDSSDGKESVYNVGDLGSIPGPAKSLGEENGNPLQYSCLENLVDRGAWWATVHGVAKSQTRLGLTQEEPSFIRRKFTFSGDEQQYTLLSLPRARSPLQSSVST